MSAVVSMCMDSGMHVLRQKHSYRMRTKTGVIKEVFEFDKSERAYLIGAEQTKHFRDEIQKAIMEAYKIYWR